MFQFHVCLRSIEVCCVHSYMCIIVRRFAIDLVAPCVLTHIERSQSAFFLIGAYSRKARDDLTHIWVLFEITHSNASTRRWKNSVVWRILTVSPSIVTVIHYNANQRTNDQSTCTITTLCCAVIARASSSSSSSHCTPRRRHTTTHHPHGFHNIKFKLPATITRWAYTTRHGD